MAQMVNSLQDSSTRFDYFILILHYLVKGCQIHWFEQFIYHENLHFTPGKSDT